MIENPCKGCSECCKYISLEIDKPESYNDFQNIIWFVIHKNVVVFIDESNKWFIEFKTPCKELSWKGLCKSYSTRPTICRSHSPDTCERKGNCYKKLFKSREDVEDYMREKSIKIRK